MGEPHCALVWEKWHSTGGKDGGDKMGGRHGLVMFTTQYVQHGVVQKSSADPVTHGLAVHTQVKETVELKVLCIGESDVAVRRRERRGGRMTLSNVVNMRKVRLATDNDPSPDQSR